MHALMRGSLPQRLRLAAGLVLFVFVITHFVNHALGLVNLDAMDTMQAWRVAIWRSWPGSIVLIGAFAVHILLALARLAQRQSLRAPIWEWLQIASGLVIPFLLLEHVVFTRVAHMLYDAHSGYDYILYSLWPGKAVMQMLLLLVVWVHGCIGIHYWLRLATWYQHSAILLGTLAVALPVTALAGFSVAGRQIADKIDDFKSFKALLASNQRPDDAGIRTLVDIYDKAIIGFAALLGAAILVIVLRIITQAMRPKVEITYTAGPTVRAPIGPTLLELSRTTGVPHASVCGGRGRCSTCRVRVDIGLESLAPPGMAEATTLGAIGAPEGVRLACQIRPTDALTVTRLVEPRNAGQVRVVGTSSDDQGVERILAIMFLDVRGFTNMSENRLPYDVVFILNRFFAALGHAISVEGGWIDKYLGDGLMAVFGRETGTEQGCRQALAAARAIDLALDEVNRELKTELGEPLKIGLGVHVGPLVIGRIGHATTAAVTVIGRTVNAASRLESLTKEKGCQLIISREVAEAVGWQPADMRAQSVQVRGLTEPLDIWLFDRARDLPTKF